MFKRRLYLDIDDTVVNTNKHIKNMLGSKWQKDGLIYCEYDNMNAIEFAKVKGVFSDYSKIPFIEGAEEGLNILRNHYDLVFCSSYYLEGIEDKAKERWAKELGIPLILCKGMSKGDIDMSGAIIVDDNPRNILRTNAGEKVLFYNEDFYESVGGVLVFSWFALVSHLCPNIAVDRLKKLQL